MENQTVAFEQLSVGHLFSMAHTKYLQVMKAAHSNNVTPSDEQALRDSVELLTKVAELQHPARGEPYALRAAMHFVYAQINRDHSYLDKAERDYQKALEIGASDPSNHPAWRQSIDQVQMVRRMM